MQHMLQVSQKRYDERKSRKVQDLWNMYKNNQIVKIRVQRKLKWQEFPSARQTTPDNKSFIMFLIRHGDSHETLHFRRSYIQHQEYGTIERLNTVNGNNRLNAIVKYIEQPLYYRRSDFPHIEELPKQLIDRMIETPLDEIVEYYDVEDFCNSNWLTNVLIKAKRSNTFAEYNKIFRNIIKLLQQEKFMQCTISCMDLVNYSENDICELFQNLNKTTAKLSRQDLLASDMYGCMFERNGNIRIDDFELLQEHVDAFYDDATDRFKKEAIASMSNITLFEVLIGLQCIASKKYPCIPYPGNAEEDIIFKIYPMLVQEEYLCVTVPQLNTFNRTFDKACHILHEISETVYCRDTSNHHFHNTHYKLEMNPLAFLLTFICTNMNKETYTLSSEHRRTVRSLMVFHELRRYLEDSSLKDMMSVKDKLYFKSGTYGKQKIQELLSGKMIIEQYAINDVDEMIKTLYDQDLNGYVPGKKRNIRRVHLLILSLYYCAKVPQELWSKRKYIDHIVPVSMNSEDSVYMNRLGNLVLLDEDTYYKKRGMKCITDEFIQDHNIKYYGYPARSTLDKLCNSTSLTLMNNKDTYIKMCESREKILKSCIIDIFR